MRILCLSRSLLANGGTLAFAGRHQEVWKQPPGDSSTPDHIQIPIFNGAERWGTVQLRFRSLDNGGWLSWLKDPWIQFLGLVVGSGFMGYFLYMKRTLRQLGSQFCGADAGEGGI